MASSVDLGKQLERFVSDLMQTGRYNSRSEILREGARLIQERETRLAAFDASIRRWLADGKAGRAHAIENVAAQLDARYAEMERTCGVQ